MTLGLYHGAAPHALVLVHRAGDVEIEGVPGHPIPPLPELVALYERLALPVRPSPVAAVAVNTGRVSDEDAREAIDAIAAETGLPADDLSVLALTRCLTPS